MIVTEQKQFTVSEKLRYNSIKLIKIRNGEISKRKFNNAYNDKKEKKLKWIDAFGIDIDRYIRNIKNNI